MESKLVSCGLFLKLGQISQILPFYGYTDQCNIMMSTLSSETRKIWHDYEDIFVSKFLIDNRRDLDLSCLIYSATEKDQVLLNKSKYSNVLTVLNKIFEDYPMKLCNRLKFWLKYFKIPPMEFSHDLSELSKFLEYFLNPEIQEFLFGRNKDEFSKLIFRKILIIQPYREMSEEAHKICKILKGMKGEHDLRLEDENGSILYSINYPVEELNELEKACILEPDLAFLEEYKIKHVTTTWRKDPFKDRNIIIYDTEFKLANCVSITNEESLQFSIRTLEKYYGNKAMVHLNFILRDFSLLPQLLDGICHNFKWFSLQLKSVEAKRHYAAKCEKCAVISYDTDLDEISIYMVPEFTISFSDFHVVDPQNDMFMILSNFINFQSKKLVKQEKSIESWRKYLAQFGTNCVAFLKKSVRELTLYDENTAINMKSLQNCNIFIKSSEQDISTFNQNLSELDSGVKISKIDTQFVLNEKDRWSRLEIGSLCHLFSNTVRELTLTKKTVGILAELKAKDLYLHKLRINSNCIQYLDLLAPDTDDGLLQKTPMIDYIYVDIIFYNLTEEELNILKRFTFSIIVIKLKEIDINY
ncbi:unnamed protein product [Moneuplotes crassus]|uniref:Uncharacterized protein n=1 Tax=Euplotes crassus TaxID=5936 RepID=A0AAD1U605_EUPCR|nr:unnamed protein product [Moneuplotes crassus]